MTTLTTTETLALDYLVENLPNVVGPEFELAAITGRPTRFVAKYYGYKLEIENYRGSWRTLFGFGTKANLLELAAEHGLVRNMITNFDTAEDALYQTQMVVEAIDEIALDNNLSASTRSVGVSFVGTNFEGYGERDFMASVVQIQKMGFANLIPSVGSNLGFEFVAPSTNSRIDAVEFNEAGEVITVIECQSGIQNGTYLDDEHFSKAISRYPQSAEVVNTVKKIVVIAGGYSAEQLATFKQLPYEIVALQTVAENGQIALQTVAY